jgi:hypothetical protein
MAKSTSIIVKDRRKVYGTVEISPDSELGMLGIANRLMSRQEVVVTNLPRSIYFLSFLEVLENLGFELVWENYNYLRIRYESVTDIKNVVDADVLKSAPTHILTFILPLLLKIKGEAEISKAYVNYIDEEFLDSLGMDILESGSKIIISTPLENSLDMTLRYDMENLDMNFLFNKILMKNIFPRLKISLPDYHIINSANVLLAEIKDNDTLVCPPSILEFKFFCSLIILLDGEIEFSGYDLKFFLSHLLRFVDLGLFYEVIDNKLRVWVESKPLELEYHFKDISTQDLALLILLESLKSKRNTRNIIPHKKHFEGLIKELNMCGCRIDYKTYQRNEAMFLDLLVKPSNITSVKVNLYENMPAMNLSILLPVFCSEARGRADSANVLEHILSNFRDNISSINLDVALV